MKKLLAMLCVVALLVTALCACAETTTQTPTQQTETSTTTETETAATADEKIKIGVSFANMQEERWNHEKVFFQEKADELGIDIVFQDANNEENKQLDQVQNLLSDGIDVLVIVPVDAKTAATAVHAAKESGVPVIDYAKFIESNELDLYIGMSIYQLGVDMASEAVKIAPKGNYALISGAPTDSNVPICVEGYYSVLQPYIDKGDITVVFEQLTENYSPEKAMAHAENALTQNDNNIDMFIVMNDGMAGGVVAALKNQGLDGKIPVTGLDGELAACQRVVEGTQAFTLYFPLKEQAGKTVEAAVELAQGKTPSLIDSTTEIAGVEVPTITLRTKTVTKDTMKEIIIDENVYAVEDVYKNVPQDQWPK